MRKGYWTALGIILFAAVFYTLLIGSLGLHRRISTSVLDLVPKEQRDPELEVARALVQSEQNRVLLIALQGTTQQGVEQQEISASQRSAFIDSLRQSGVFASVLDIAGEDMIKGSAALFFDLRGQLLFPAYLAKERENFATAQAAGTVDHNDFAAYLATATVERLDTFLDTAEALAYQQMIPRDPQLLMIAAFNNWRAANAGLLQKPPADTLLVWAKLSASPFSASGQQPVFDALEQARLAAQAEPGAAMLSLRDSGISRFAQANERGIRTEVTFFNIASVCAVLLICALMLRSPSVLFHSIALLCLSLPFAWLVTLLLFDSVPIIALVIGSVLVGVAIDYCLHVFLDGKGDHGAPLLRPLLLSCGTTAIAFLALTFSPLPLLAQTGVFVATGLLATCALALLYRRILGHHIHASVRGEIVLRRPLRWQLPMAILLALLAIGISRIEWNDSVDNLQYPLPNLRAEDAAVRSLFGAGNKQVYLTSAPTFAAARTALKAFEDALPHGSQMTNLAQWTPLAEDYYKIGNFLRQHPDFAQKLTAALETGGYETESFAPFFADFEQWQQLPFDADGYESLLENLQNNLPGPAGNMIGSGETAHFFISTGTAGQDGFSPPQGTIKVDTLYSLSNIFTRYRHNALDLSLWGIAVIVIGSLVVYGPRRGTRLLMVPAVAGFAALGTVGFLQGQLNLFHLIGLFLGVCLALDYGAFALRNKGATSIPYSVCVAAATSVSAFLLLGLSHIPAVVALGSTVALCIAYAFIFALLLTTPPPPKR